MAHCNPKEKPGSSINITDWSGELLNIKLDSKLTIIKNAEKYFEKSRDTLKALELRQKKIPGTKKNLEEANEILNKMESVSNMKEVEHIEKQIKQEFGTRGSNTKAEPADKFRQFDLGEGYILYVGKSAANNDELTMRFARPNDLWLHARGSGGSHCVLRAPTNDKVPKHMLKRAAEITAYYSQSRKAKYVHVVYTQKKYVRKPKGANTGSVTLSKEEVIMVEPKLPE